LHSSKNLQPDWQRATSLTVLAIYAQLNSTIPVPVEVPNPLAFVPPSDARWINGLWFTSLTLSLAVSLLAILAKQWVNEFLSRMRAPISSPKMWAMRHSAFKGGLDRWGMDTFISALPLLLHASLFLFLIGLCLLLLPLDKTIAAVVIVITAIVGAFYIATGLAPVIWGDCPTVTPVLRHIYSLWHSKIGPAFRWTFVIVYLTLIAYPGLVLFGLPYAVCAWCFTRVWDFPNGPVLRGLQSALEFLVVEVERRHLHALWRYRSPTFSAPACDQARILAEDYEPLHEASILSWMIRTLPVDSDVNAAISAVGWLRAGAHHTYFHGRNQISPLTDEAMQRAALDALDGIVAQGYAVDEAAIATILRACLFVAVKPLELTDSTKQFLRPYAQLDPDVDDYCLRYLSSSALHSHQDWPHESSQQLQDLDIELAELIALSGAARLRGRERTRVITRLAIMAAEKAQPRHPASIVSALESEILKHIPRRLIGWSVPVCEDSRLRFIAALDIGLRHPHSLGMNSSERCALVFGYGAAARSLASDPKVKLPPDLQHLLHLTTSHHFRDYEFPVADLNAIGNLLLHRLPDDRTSIDPVALSGLLDHFKRRRELLPLLPESLEWIKAAFSLPPDSSDLVKQLQQHRSVKLALHNSHLSLLRHVTICSETQKQSPWSRLLDLLPVSDSRHNLCELAFPYTIQLLVLHKNGHSVVAQDNLRELLPIERRASLIAHGSSSRFHLALHAKFICDKWWLETSAELRRLPATAWTACAKYPDANSFLNALSAEGGCLVCAQDSVPIRWGSRPLARSANDLERISSRGTSLAASGGVDPLVVPMPSPLPASEPFETDMFVASDIGVAERRRRGERESDGLLESGLLKTGASSS